MQTQAIADSICPDLTQTYQIGQIAETQQVILQSNSTGQRWAFSEMEGFALRYFTGRFTISQVQAACEQQFGSDIDSTLVERLCQKLSAGEIRSPSTPRYQLKPSVHWIAHPEGYWILRNPEDVTFLQVSNRDQQAIEQMLSGAEPENTARLLQLLATTGMLVGTQAMRPPKRKFTPLQLLFFRIRLFNPDRWLSQHVAKLQWIWTSGFAIALTIFLIASSIVGSSYHAQILATGQRLWIMQGTSLLIPFALLCGAVVAIHELGHAFTLKHLGGIVPEIGLLVMCFTPGCYTNTTDAYCLTRRSDRALVVAAGVFCQITIWAIAFWMWLLLTPETWLKTSSYLLMVTALLTVAINLNPLAKFDGYYLAVALTGINNLRSRSFLLYLNLFRNQPIRETKRDRRILAIYAPLSLLYSLFIFGHLLLWIIEWSVLHIPTLAFTLLFIWALYYYFPRQLMTSASNPSDFKPSTQPVADTKSVAANSVQKTQISIPRFWIIAGTLLVGVGILMFVPVSETIVGDAVINTTPGARQLVTMPEAGIIRAILVRTGDRVKLGQVVAELSSRELEERLNEVDRKLTEAMSERFISEQQLNLAQSRKSESIVRLQTSTERATRVQRDAGIATPRIELLRQQQVERQREITGWQAQLTIVNAQIERETGLVQAGALALSLLDEPKRQQAALTSQIAAAQSQIAQLDAQIATVQKDLWDEWQNQRQPEVEAANATLRSSNQEIMSAETVVQKWAQQLPLLQAERQRILARQAQLTLKATISGVITTPDLDLLVNQRLAEGKELLTIADQQQSTASVDLPQIDAARLRVGMPVTFRLQDGDLQGFNAKVLEIPPMVAPESPQQPQQKPMVKVRVGFDAGTGFTFGTRGYARIEVGYTPPYRKIMQEVLKLIPAGKLV